MQFYSIDYYLEQKYFVEKSAFNDAIKNALEYVKDIKAHHFQTNFSDEDIFIDIEIEINKKSDLQKTILQLQEAIEDSIYSLTDTIPTNIKIDVKNSF